MALRVTMETTAQSKINAWQNLAWAQRELTEPPALMGTVAPIRISVSAEFASVALARAKAANASPRRGRALCVSGALSVVHLA